MSRNRIGTVIVLINILLSGCISDSEPVISAGNDSDLLILARENRGSEIGELLAPDSGINRSDDEGRTALHWAVLNRDQKTVRLLLERGANPNAFDKTGLTPLHLSIINRDSETGKVLVSYGADVLFETPMGENALTLAFERDLTLLEFLVKKEHVNLLLPTGETILHIAVRNGHKDFIQYLVGIGADVGKLDASGKTPLDVALEYDDHDHMEVAGLLVSKGAPSPANQDKDYFYRILLSDTGLTRFEFGKTGYHLAAERNHLGILSYLIEQKVGDINTQDNSGNTALHLAAIGGNAAAVELLIGGGAQSDRVNYFGNTPLHEAVKVGGNTIMASQLIQSGADINAKNNFGNTPLHIVAAQSTDPLLIRLLVDSKAEIDSRSKTGNTPLIEAMEKSNKEAALALISFGADIFAQNNRGVTPVQLALSGGPSVMEWFFTERIINHNNNSGETPLHIAIKVKAPVETIVLLLDRGSDPNQRDAAGNTPLHLATIGKVISYSDVLFLRGADPFIRNNSGESPLVLAMKSDLDFFNRYLPEDRINITDRDGETPLFKAVSENIYGVVELLIKVRKADIQWKNNKGQTALFLAVTSETIPLIKLLIAAGCPVNGKDSFGNTPIFYVSLLTSPISVGDLLLSQGADLKVKNNEGRTLLHESVISGNSFFIKYLIDRGADINSIDNSGQTPLFLAVKEDFGDIVRFLVEKGAYLEYRDQDGNTVLHRALITSRWDLALYLISRGSDLYALNKRGKTPLDLILFLPPDVAAPFFSPAMIKRFDNLGNSPLHYAVSRKAPLEILALLINKGADIYARNSDGKRAMDIARDRGYTEAIPLLETEESQ